MRLQSLFRTQGELARYRYLSRLLCRYLCRTANQLWKLNPTINP
jgi:hypothetical protein